MPLPLAGLWEPWRDLKTCTIVTTAANAAMRPVHDCMLLIIEPAQIDEWLDPENPDPKDVLAATPSEELELVPASSWVNNPRHDAPPVQGGSCGRRQALSNPFPLSSLTFLSYNPLAVCPFSAASVLPDAHGPKGARMGENTNLLESGTAPASGMTDQEEANTAPKIGASEADEAPTASGGGTTNREKSRTGGPTDTWTVRGVEIETRRAAKLAAKREGKFLGDWLNDTIRTVATATLKGNTLPARPEDVTDVLQRLLDERLQPITEQLKALSDQRPPAPLPPRTLWQRLTGRA